MAEKPGWQGLYRPRAIISSTILGYYSGNLVDGDGKRVRGAGVDAWFDALRFVQTTEHKILGGNWGWHAILPLVHQSVNLGAGA